MEMFYISSIHYGNHWLPVAFVHLKHVICLRKGIFKVLFNFNLNRHTCLVATYYMDSTALEFPALLTHIYKLTCFSKI